MEEWCSDTELLARSGPLFDKVVSVHGKNHPELQHMTAMEVRYEI